MYFYADTCTVTPLKGFKTTIASSNNLTSSSFASKSILFSSTKVAQIGTCCSITQQIISKFVFHLVSMSCRSMSTKYCRCIRDGGEATCLKQAG